MNLPQSVNVANAIAIGTSAVGAISWGLTAIARFVNKAQDYTAHYKNTSLAEVAKLTRVEPITIVSKDLLNNPETKDVLNSLLSIFTGYYLQAVDILTKVQDVEVVKILDRLNPDRDETGFLLGARTTAGESFRYISTENYMFRLPVFSMPALESKGPSPSELADKLAAIDTRITALKNRLAKLRADPLQPGFKVQESQFLHQIKMLEHEAELLKRSAEEKERDNAVDEREEDRKLREYKEQGSEQDVKIDLDTLVNLSIGRVVNVKIAYTKKEGEHIGENRYVTIPISVRLMVSSIPTDTIVRIMTYHHQDMSFNERLHSARSGRIGFIRDLIFCQDLIDEYKKASIKDSSNVLNDVINRANNAKKYGLLTNNPSLVAASSLFVISDTVAREVESKLGGKLDNPRIRDKAFENTYAMIIAIVSDEWETVTFYTRGIARGASFGFRELEGKSGGSGPDVTDIMKALSAGQPPSF